ELADLRDPVRFFTEETWTAGVLGLGYVGLPLLLTASDAGLGGVGFDVSPARVSALQQSHSMVDDVSDRQLREAVERGVIFTTDEHDLVRADALFICVPSPLGRNRQPDLSYIEAVAGTIERVARRGQLIVLESTTYPGTTEDILAPALRRAGHEMDNDVYLAFSPERVSPGDELKTAAIPKVVGGFSPLSGDVAEAAYRRLVPDIHRVSSARAAEMTKLLENTYRAVNIGLINELAQLAHELDIDIWEVIDAASTKPFGFQPFYPGPGVGGHCIPLDPQYLAWRAREANFTTRFIDAAEQVNSRMPMYNADRVAGILNEQGMPVQGTEILAIGVSYKKDIADDRESAALGVLDELKRRGAAISVLDPVVGSERISSLGYKPVEMGDSLDHCQMAVILTDHSTIDYQLIVDAVPIIYDTRGVLRRLGIESSKVTTL
ncbi:MAG TPA: nucleotide sugar dehydrogenase, partial [Acidimicrobiia bacterium]|nr:nucleotide sugar dehydrogenase [Acidimicrobiia bacterium]